MSSFPTKKGGIFLENKNFIEFEDRNYRLAILSAIRGDNTDQTLREILADYHDNDIAAQASAGDVESLGGVSRLIIF